MFARSGKRQREECTRRINHPPLIPPLAGLLRLLVCEPMCVKSRRPRGRAPPCESRQTFCKVSAAHCEKSVREERRGAKDVHGAVRRGVPCDCLPGRAPHLSGSHSERGPFPRANRAPSRRSPCLTLSSGFFLRGGSLISSGLQKTQRNLMRWKSWTQFVRLWSDFRSSTDSRSKNSGSFQIVGLSWYCFRLQYNPDILALSISQYWYQSDISTPPMIHTLITYLASSDITPTKNNSQQRWEQHLLWTFNYWVEALEQNGLHFIGEFIRFYTKFRIIWYFFFVWCWNSIGLGQPR